MEFSSLETERMYLKNISFEDREFILKQFSDAAVTQYLYDEEPFHELEEAEELINYYVHTEPKLQHRWILVQKETNEPMGTCGFHNWNQSTHSTEVGYDLQKAYWGQGYMCEAMKAIIEFAKKEMKVNCIHAHIYVNNERSIQLAKRCGFAFRGETVNYTFRGENYLHHIYTLDC